jgi:hypothetical protein
MAQSTVALVHLSVVSNYLGFENVNPPVREALG